MTITMRSEGSPAADRISNLPNNVTEQILGSLPLHDATRTSILSREWRYKWVEVRSELVFDANNIDKGLLKTIIYQALLIHQGPLRKFSLQVSDFELSPDIDYWILFLSKKYVQEFSLRFPYRTDFRLPSHLFRFQDLRHLELCSCKLHPPPNFKAFSRLVTVNFRHVTFEPTSFQTLLSSCPLSECVTLDWCKPFDNLNVDAPGLKFFEFIGTTNTICFEKTPLLEEIIMSITSNFLKPFTVGLRVSQVTLHNFKILNFQYFNFSCVKGVAHMLNLINCCPNVDRLAIASFAFKSLVEPVVRLLRAQGTPHTALKQLKRVDMKFLLAHEPEIEFLTYVLSVAASLEKLCVETYVSYMTKKVYDVEPGGGGSWE